MKIKLNRVQSTLFLALVLSTSTVSRGQSDELIANNVAAPVAYVYLQTLPGVMVYAASSSGRLTVVPGSPFPVVGEMQDITGKYLISVESTGLDTYSIHANGSIGGRISRTNTAAHGGSECGATSDAGSTLEHTGKYLYVEFSDYYSCAAWQTYQVLTNGHLQFKGDRQYFERDEGGDYIPSTLPTISSNDKFGYGVFLQDFYSGSVTCNGGWMYCPDFSVFVKNSSGVLTPNHSFVETPPTAASGFKYIPSGLTSPEADPSGHLAVLMNQIAETGETGPLQLASFTINPTTGSISSTNGYWNTPTVGVTMDGFITMDMSPSGKLIAIGGYSGLQVLHFNGAGPPTYYSSVLLPSVNFQRLKWDNNNHLYAYSYYSGQLYVLTVTPTSITQAVGSPYSITNPKDGKNGLVVIP